MTEFNVILMPPCQAVPELPGSSSPQGITVSQHYPCSVHVQTNGGVETSAISGSNISNAELKAAVEIATTKNKVFRTSRFLRHTLVLNRPKAIINISNEKPANRPTWGSTLAMLPLRSNTLSRPSRPQFMGE